MRALLIHTSFNTMGGGEFLALNAAVVLNEAKLNVTLLTYAPIDEAKVKEFFGIDVRKFNVIVRRMSTIEKLERVVGGRFVRLKKLMAYKNISMDIMKMLFDYDLIMETQTNIPSPADLCYIHYPTLLNFFEVKGRGLIHRLYNMGVKLYARGLKNLMRAGTILTNSLWTAAQTYKAYRVVADVVYPPVDVEYFSKASSNDKREKIVVTLSRFAEEKKLDRIVDLASKLRDYVFILMGSTDRYSHKVLEKIEAKVKNDRLDNVIVETNLPRSKVLSHMEEARFYLHPEFAEHFGIAVVEAMAAGLVPIVYMDGGAWYDVVSRVDEMLGYRRIEEALEIIKRIESNEDLYRRLRERGMEVSKMFNYQNFKSALLEKVYHVLKVKEIARSSGRYA